MEFLWFMMGAMSATAIGCMVHIYRSNRRQAHRGARVIHTDAGTFKVSDSGKLIPLCACSNCAYTRRHGGYMPCLVRPGYSVR